MRNLNWKTWKFWKPIEKLWHDWHMTDWQILRIAKNTWRIINTIASIWLWNYAQIFVLGHHLFLEAHSFPRASLSENCSLLGTDNVRGQISEHIFAPNGGYCLYIYWAEANSCFSIITQLIIREKQEPSEKCQICLFASNCHASMNRDTVWRSHAQSKSHAQSINYTCPVAQPECQYSYGFSAVSMRQSVDFFTISVNECWVSPTCLPKQMEMNQAVWCKTRRWRVLGLCSHNFLLVAPQV